MTYDIVGGKNPDGVRLEAAAQFSDFGHSINKIKEKNELELAQQVALTNPSVGIDKMDDCLAMYHKKIDAHCISFLRDSPGPSPTVTVRVLTHRISEKPNTSCNQCVRTNLFSLLLNNCLKSPMHVGLK